MTMKFVKHGNDCWHAFDDCATVDTAGLEQGFVRAYGEVWDMGDKEFGDCSTGYISFYDGQPVWNANFITSSISGVGENLTASNLREIADFIESLRGAQDSELARLGLA